MIKQTGTVSSYKQLGEQFLNFVQKSNDTTEPWEVIDDRLDSFYGATIKFPVDKSPNASVPKLKADISKVVMLTVSPFFNCFCPEIAQDYYASDDDVLDSHININGSVYADFLKALFLSLYSSEYVNDVFMDSLFFADGTSYRESIQYSAYLPDKDNAPKTDLNSYCNYILNIDFSNTTVLKSDTEDFSWLIDKRHVIILFPVVTLPYYYGLESIYYKISTYINNLRDKIREALISNNISVDSNDLHIDVLFYYYPSTIIDMISDGSDLHIISSSLHAVKNYLSTLRRKVIGDFYFVNLLDIYSDKTYDSLVNDLSMHEADSIVFDDFLPDGSVHNSVIAGVNDAYSISKISWLPIVNYHVSKENVNLKGIGSGSDSLMVYEIWNFDVSVQYYTFKSISDISIDGRRINFSNKIFDRTYAYISLQYNKITHTTYNEWLTNTKDNYMSESFDSRRRIPAYYNNAETWRTVTISNQYQNDIANIFKDTGELLFISPHIKYDKNLWMCEQGGIACDQETRTQNIEDNCIRHRKLTSNFSGYDTQNFVKVPPFPSLGCPMFTINSNQLAQEEINYYFIRDNTSASIVVYVPSPDSMTYHYTVQHMSFGVLDSFSISEQFMYPLYVCGGNGGLCQDHWTYYSPGSSTPSHEVGNIYKLDMENITMSNSNILLSARFNGANVSNFRVLCPDGHWDNIFNVTQNVSLIVDPDQCWPDSWTPRYYLLQQPVVGGSELGDVRYGGTTTLNGANSIKRIDTGYIIPEYRATQIVEYSKTFHANAVIQPVMPVFSSHKLVSSEGWPRHRYGIIGKIPRCYSTWSRHLKFGELEIGGKKFLSIPSAYDYRIWYPAYKTKVDLANLESNVKSDANTDNVLYNKYIYDYLLLKLED